MVTQIITERLHENPAVQAWKKVHPHHTEPSRIEVVRRKRKSCVYRLQGVGPGGAAVIAKRSQTTTANLERLIYEEVLAHLRVPALRCYGFLEEPEAGFSWLFLEDAGVHEFSVWPAAFLGAGLAGA